MAFTADKVKTLDQVTGGRTDAATMYTMLYSDDSSDLSADTAEFYNWGVTEGFVGGEFIIVACRDKPVFGYTVVAAGQMKLVLFADS